MEKLIEKARVTFRRRHDLYKEICGADTFIIRRLAFLPRVRRFVRILSLVYLAGPRIFRRNYCKLVAST